MSHITKYVWFKIVSTILIAASITFDIAWAHPYDGVGSQKLSVPLVTASNPPTQASAAFKNTIYKVSGNIAAVTMAAKFLLGDHRRGQIEYLASTLSNEISQCLKGIDLPRALIVDEVILIPLVRDGKRHIIFVTQNFNSIIKELPGDDFPIASPDFTAKIIAEDCAKIAAKPTASTVVASADRATPQATSSASLPKIIIDKPIAGMSLPKATREVLDKLSSWAPRKHEDKAASTQIPPILGHVAMPFLAAAGLATLISCGAVTPADKKPKSDKPEQRAVDTDKISPTEKLITDLKNDDWNICTKAAKALREIKYSTHIEALTKALEDNDWVVRHRAAEALGEIGDLAAEEPLKNLLKKETDKNVRFAAENALGKIKAVVDDLVALLYDDNANVVERTIERLGEIKDPRAVEPLIILAGGSNPKICKAAIEALRKISDPRARDVLIKAINHRDSSVRYAAANALGNLNWKPETQRQNIAYLFAKRDEDALVRIGPPAVNRLIETLKIYNENSNVVRQFAIKSLGEIKDRRAVEPLVGILDDIHSDIRACAADALDKLKWRPETEMENMAYLFAKKDWAALEKIGHRATFTLSVRVNDTDSSVRQSVVEILDKLNWKPQTHYEDIYYRIAKKDWEGVVGIALCDIGQYHGVASALERIILLDEDWQICKAAIEALYKLRLRYKDIHQISSILITALEGENPEIRSFAADILTGALKDERNRGNRLIIIDRLVSSGAEFVIPILKKALSEEKDADAKEAIQSALDKLSSQAPQKHEEKVASTSVFPILGRVATLFLAAVSLVLIGAGSAFGAGEAAASPQSRLIGELIIGSVVTIAGIVVTVQLGKDKQPASDQDSAQPEKPVPSETDDPVARQAKDASAQDTEPAARQNMVSNAPRAYPLSEKDVETLFEKVYGNVNNLMTRYVNEANTVIDFIGGDRISEDMTVLECAERALNARKAVKAVDRVVVPQNIQDAVDWLSANTDDFIGKKTIASLIIRARAAEREKQNLTIRIETDWIERVASRGAIQRQAGQVITQKLYSLGDELKKMGIMNVEIIPQKGADITSDIGILAEKNPSVLKHNVALASLPTIDTVLALDAIKAFDGDNLPFLAGVDVKNLDGFIGENPSEDTERILDIKVFEMISAALELSVLRGVRLPITPAGEAKAIELCGITVIYDIDRRYYIFTPSANTNDYEKLSTRDRARRNSIDISA